MSRLDLEGVCGTNPLGFMTALGLLRLLYRREDGARLGFVAGGSYHAFVETEQVDIPKLVAEDALLAAQESSWRLEYDKQEKAGVKRVSDLKPPPEVFREFLHRAAAAWTTGDPEPAGYAAAFGTSVAVDGKGNMKPTAFHFTAAQQQFLGNVELIRAMVTRDWAEESLFRGGSARPGGNLRWDPGANRNWALMAGDPTTDGTSVDAPAEWLSFRALPLFPTMPWKSRVLTAAVTGRGEDTTFTWPLWSLAASLPTIRSLLTFPWGDSPRERAARGIFALCSSAIRRSTQGFGNFAPATVST